MAEVTGLVVGVLSLGVQLVESVQKVRRFHEAMKDAREKLASIIDEIELLSAFLTEMEENHVSCDTYAKPGLQRCIASCQKAVDQFSTYANSLESRIKRHRRRGSLMFIMKSESIEEVIAQLERSKSSLGLVYTLYRSTVADEHARQMKAAMQTLIDSNALLTQQALRSRDMCPSNTTTRQVYRKKNFGGNGRDGKFRFRTPSWLSYTIWEVFVERATAGWTTTLRAYSIIPYDSAIFRACQRGDTSRMKQLFEGGFASPFDESRSGEGIFEMALRYAQIDVARFLHRYDHRALKPLMYSACIGPRWFSATGTDHRQVAWQELDEASISTLQETLRFLIEDCDNPLVDQPYPENYLDIDRFVRGDLKNAMFVWFWTSARHLTSHDFIQKKLDMAFPPVHMNYLIQHKNFDEEFEDTHVKVLAQAYTLSSDEGDLEYWEGLIIKAVELGLDLHDGGDGVSPLLNLLHIIINTCPMVSTRRQVQTMHKRLKNWLSLLQRAGVDLSLYGQEECRLLADLQYTCEHPWLWSGKLRDQRSISEELMAANPEFSFDVHNTVAVFTFTYGPSPDDWKLWFCHPGDRYAGPFWRMIEEESLLEGVEHPVGSHVPGAWQDDY